MATYQKAKDMVIKENQARLKLKKYTGVVRTGEKKIMYWKWKYKWNNNASKGKKLGNEKEKWIITSNIKAVIERSIKIAIRFPHSNGNYI